MNRFNRAMASLAVLALAALAGTAQAEDQHFHVGDLSQPDQLAAFNHSLDKATVNLCGAHWDHLSQRNAYLACVAGVRDEAMSQLTPAQRQQYAAAMALHLASNAHGGVH